QLFDEFGPERVMFKPEAAPLGPNLTALREATHGRARVFEGSGGVALVDSYHRGIVGTMPGAELIRAMVALWQALVRGKESNIYRLSLPIGALVQLQTGLDGFLAVEKYLLVKQGIFKNTVVRGPVAFRLDEETRREVDRLFELVCEAVSETATAS
ncbi:MAG TPA: dihydrodipicolinate synthase family protein, partial [Gemmataceae bacterium]|nr:dihydrodipicolinate synthase family protein [Gemmataceae bacterium]